MTRKFLTTVMVLAAMGLALSGCSPTTGEWTDRGRQGVTNAEHNYTLMYRKALAAEDAKLAGIIAGAMEDIKLARDGQLPGASAGSSQLSDKWLTETQAGLEVAISQWTANREKLRDEYEAGLRNLGLTTECFDKVDKLNRAWAGSSQELSRQIADLRVMIRQMQRSNQPVAVSGQ